MPYRYYNKYITVVTTIDFCFRPINIILRAYRLFKNCEKIGIKVIVGHANRYTIYDNLFLKIYKNKFKNIKIVSVQNNTSKINNSILRNRASEKVDTKYILYSDIDLYFDADIITYILKECTEKNFSIIPCLYLSKKGTKFFNKYKNRKMIINQWLLWKVEYIKHLAIPSSFMCIEKNVFNIINGFDEKYEGHGYEDFDFMIRVISYYKCINFNNRSLIDKTYISPLFAEGFRADISIFCMKSLLNKIIVIHLYHKKNKKIYKIDRNNNRLIFLTKLKKIIYEQKLEQELNIVNIIDNKLEYLHIYTNLQKNTPKIVTLFYNLCIYYGINIEEFSVLFFNRSNKKC